MKHFLISLFALAAACGPPSPDSMGGDDDDTPGHGSPDAGLDVPDAADPNTVDDDGDGTSEDQGDCDDTDATVNEDGTEVPGNGADDDCDEQLDEVLVCASGGDFTTIQAAINAAPEGGAVNVCAGTYPEHLSVTRSVVLHALGAVIVDASGTGSGLTVSYTHMTIDGFTFRHGSSSGVRCDHSIFNIFDSTVSDNVAGGAGGGIYLNECTGQVLNCVVQNNQAERGGGIFQQEGNVQILDSQILWNAATSMVENRGIGGGIYSFSHATMTGNTISNNIAANRGGGIVVEDHNPVLDANTVKGNKSGDDGAGIYVIMSNLLENQEITIKNSTFDGNESAGDAGGIRLLGAKGIITGNTISNNKAIGDGGGMKISHDKSLIQDNVISGNKAGYGGGGIEVDDDHSTIIGNIITGNRAHHGGGVNYHESLDSFKMSNTLIYDNHATSRGGGINFDEPSNTIVAEFSFLTVVGNTAPDTGGAQFETGHVKVDNSIFAGNEGTQVKFETLETWEGWQTGGVLSWTYSDITPMAVEGMDNPTGSAGNISTTPGFVSDSDFHLAAGSACMNAGDPAIKDPDQTRANMGAYGGPSSL